MKKSELFKMYEEAKQGGADVFMVILYIHMPTGEEEIICNPNVEEKMKYIDKTYNDDLVHANCSDIYIRDAIFSVDGGEREFKEGKGVILFLNRRGYSESLHCNTCGETFQCPNCSVSLTYHKRRHRLECHICGYSEKLPEVCPNCSSHDIKSVGFGTEQIEDEVRRLFPFKKVCRLDSDASGGDRKYIAKVLSDFKEGKIDILLGTQMIAKGLNFPLVSLVGVVNADISLHVPSFRANERTYELLKQVAGRVGRYRPDGKVIVQTSEVANRAIRAIELNEDEEFYYEELDARRALNFPPYSRLVDYTLRSKVEEKARTGAFELE